LRQKSLFKPKGRATLPRRQADRQVSPTNDIPHAHLLAPGHFTIREDGAIVAAGILPAVEPGFQPGGKTMEISQASEDSAGVRSKPASEPGGRMPPSTSGRMPDATPPRLIFSSGTPFIRLRRGCVGIELDLNNVEIAAKRVDREIIEIWLRHFRVRIDVSFVGRAELPLRQEEGFGQDLQDLQDSFHSKHPEHPVHPVGNQNDLDLFSDSINGSRDMADVPEIPTERIFHECKFVFLACRLGQPRRSETETGSVVHTTVDVSLQEAWAKTPTGKKRETTHVVRCETEIFRVKS
jgi:hypothetical protein